MTRNQSPDPSGASVLELDDVFTAVGHPRRRYLVYTLATGRSEETLDDLARKLAAWEQDIQTDEVSEENRRRVYVSLYHSHIPKLADLDILEVEAEEDVIVRASNIEQVETVLAGAGAELDSRQEDHATETDV